MSGTRLRAVPVVVSALLVVVAVLWAIAPQLWSGHDPIAGDLGSRLQPPSAVHWFGTDDLGRDVFSRVVHGARMSLLSAVVAVAIGLVLGSLVGIVAGVAGQLLDAIVTRVLDVLLALPTLLFAILVIGIVGFGTLSVAVSVGLAVSATFARLMRAEVRRVLGLGYVEAAIVNGSARPAIIVEHVVPNSLRPVLALATVELAGALLAVAALSYLGFGATPPSPEWGAMIATGQSFLPTAPWLSLLPGAVVVAVALSIHVLSTLLRERGRI